MRVVWKLLGIIALMFGMLLLSIIGVVVAFWWVIGHPLPQ